MDDGILTSAEELVTTLAPAELDQTLHRITAAAVEALPDVDYASITIRHVDATLETVATTDPTLCDLDTRQYELEEGPCFEAATDVEYVSAPDLANDPRYVRYAETALKAGIAAQAGVRLFDAPTSQAALNLYSRRAGAFAEFESVAALFARQSATVIEYAKEIQALHETARTRDLVGRAVGIAMERYGLPDHRAYALLTRLAHKHDVALPVVAQSVLSASEGRADY